MRDSAMEAVSLAAGRSRASLDEDRTLLLAVTHLVEMTGEAVKHVPKDVRDRHPNVPWQDIAGTRDRLIHDYFDVNLDILWDIITNDLPPLIEDLQEILNE